MDSGYTLEDVYNETSTNIVKIIYDIMFGIHISLTPIVIFLILTKSKDMKIYRWYMLSEILFCTLANTCMIATKIVILSPLPIVIITGPLEEILAEKNYFHVFVAELALYGLINFVILVISASLYRLSVLLNFTWIVPIFEKGRYVMVWVIISQIIVVTIVHLFVGQPLSSNDFLMLDEEKILSSAPFLEPLLEKHKIFGFIGNPDTLNICLTIIVIIIIIAFLITISLSLISLFVIRHYKHLRSKQTYKMQLMFYKSVLIQAWNFILLDILSVALICGFILFKVRNTFIVVQLVFALMELHGILDLCFIMYFITPYRKFIKAKIPIFKKQSNVQVIQLPRTSNVQMIQLSLRDRTQRMSEGRLQL